MKTNGRETRAHLINRSLRSWETVQTVQLKMSKSPSKHKPSSFDWQVRELLGWVSLLAEQSSSFSFRSVHMLPERHWLVPYVAFHSCEAQSRPFFLVLQNHSPPHHKVYGHSPHTKQPVRICQQDPLFRFANSLVHSIYTVRIALLFAPFFPLFWGEGQFLYIPI